MLSESRLFKLLIRMHLSIMILKSVSIKNKFRKYFLKSDKSFLVVENHLVMYFLEKYFISDSPKTTLKKKNLL